MKIRLLPALILLLTNAALAQPYLSGYRTTITGGGFGYHAPQPDVHAAMLVQSNMDHPEIEWETMPLPGTNPGGKIQLLMLAAIDVNAEDPQRWEMLIDSVKYFTIHSPADTLLTEITWNGPEESSLTFRKKDVDRNGDLTGYLILTLNSKPEYAGRPLNIRVYGQDNKSPTWFMVYEYAPLNRVEIVTQPGLKRGSTGPEQVIRIDVIRYSEPATTIFEIAGNTFYKEPGFGFNRYFLQIPASAGETVIPVKITSDQGTLTDEEVTLKPVREMTIHLLPHSHADIGHTAQK
ncbi:MAG: hypothetical protein ACLFPE_11610, partial [Bacteroidales bacterium]